MTKKTSKRTRVGKWNRLTDLVSNEVPTLSGWWDDFEDFAELKVKAMPDGTVLAIGKGYGPDGTPVVCFGAGYSVTGAFLAIDATIAAGRWKVDEPYQAKES